MATAGSACKAYNRLDERLSQSYESYRRLRQNEKLGQDPDMYETNTDCTGERKPSSITSDYLRGGVISTMATFEAFLEDLINEATDLIVNKTVQDLDTINCHMSTHARCNDSKRERLQPKGVLLHNWDSIYNCTCTCTCQECQKAHKLGLYPKFLLTNEQIRDKKTFIDIMLKQGDINVFYNIQFHKKSLITVSKDAGNPGSQDKSFICAMLRFCYGVRCVMAHGNAEETYKKHALKDFPECKICHGGCQTMKCLKDTKTLVDHYRTYIQNLKKKTGIDEATRTKELKIAEDHIRRIPTATGFQELKKKNETFLDDDVWTKCFKIITTHFPDQTVNPLPASYAYFHMIRVYYWLEESRRGMFVTYGLFERITTFIHTLSFRMYLAVAELLIDNYGLPDGVWGVEKIKIETMITDFEAQLKT